MNPTSGTPSDTRRVALLVTRLVSRKRALLLAGGSSMPARRRALPLDFSDQRPLEAALARNIQAAIASGPASCRC